MNLDQAYQICKRPAITEQESILVIEYYIKLRTGRVVDIQPSSMSRNTQQAITHTQLMTKAFKVAHQFILSYKERPDTITVETYE